MQTNDVEMYVLVHISNTRSRKNKRGIACKVCITNTFLWLLQKVRDNKKILI